MSQSFDFAPMIEDDLSAASVTGRASLAKITYHEDASIDRPENDTPATAEKPHDDDDDDESLADQDDAPNRRSSASAIDIIAHGKTIVPQPKASSEPSRSSQEKQVRIASLPSGIDLDNVIKLQKSGPEMTPPTSSATTSTYSLRNRGAKQGKLAYDVKYHPMDDLIRPSQAAKRRSAHGEELILSDNSSKASTITETDADESRNEESEPEEQPKPTARGKKRSLTKSQVRSVQGTRRSTRKVSDPKTSYNMDIHPQDKFLDISSDDDDEETKVSARKRRKLANLRVVDNTSSDEGIYFNDEATVSSVETRTKHQDGIYSNDEATVPSVETGNDKECAAIIRTSSPMSSVATPPPYGIRRKEGLDVWHMQPGERNFHHDRDTWPMSPGQPFQIFDEKLEDQLAREAMAASPLNYEHDDKENEGNTADLEPLPDMYEGISVMPASQYRQSNEDRQLSQHRALMSEALYDDPPPSSYGLDGTHGTREDQSGAFTECLDILLSGGHLPRGNTQQGPQVDTQNSGDSVLSPDIISSNTLGSGD